MFTKKKTLLVDVAICAFLAVIAAITVILVMKTGIPSGADFLPHFNKITILMESFPNVSGWNRLWFFGCPFLRFFPPLSYYIYAVLGWLLQLSVFDALKFGIALIFAIGAASTYLLTKELGLKRFESTIASILFITTYNIYVWLNNGNIPLITAVMFVPLVLLTYLRANKKPNLTRIMCAGVTLFVASLIGDTIILAILLAGTSIALLIINPELLAVRVGHNLPPRYTMILPKVFASTIIVAAVLGAWSWLPFFIENGNIGILLRAFPQGLDIGLWDLLFASGSFSGYYYVGIGQLLVGLGGIIVCIKQREKHHKLVLSWFVLSIICGLLPFAGLSTYFFRWGPYIGLFTAILGGLFFNQIRTRYQKTRAHKFIPFFFCSFLLLVLVYPAVMQANQTIPTVTQTTLGSEWTTQEELDTFDWLQTNTNIGERIALSGEDTSDLAFNIFTTVSQTYGSELQAMTNDFAYVFWYNIFEVPRVDAAKYAPYFVRNFNVKYFVDTDLPGMNQVYPRVYELEGFSSSFVEIVDSEDILVLVIGEDVDYAWIFEGISPVNPWEVVLVKGGDNIMEYNIETLKLFDVIYIYGLRNEDIDESSNLLQDYVKDGGGLIVDTGKIVDDEEISGIADPVPVSQTMTGESHYDLSESEQTVLTEGIDFSKFSSWLFNVSYSTVDALKEDAKVLVTAEDRPVVAYWSYGEGKVLWSGLHLPYHTMLYKNDEEARFLVSMLRFVAQEQKGKTASAEFTYENSDEINVFVSGASQDDAVWVKESYYQGWTAHLVSSEGKKELPIFLAGPDMMLIFPMQEGDCEVSFRFEKSSVVTILEYISIVGLVLILLIIVLTSYGKRVNSLGPKWDKTEHTGLNKIRRAVSKDIM